MFVFDRIESDKSSFPSFLFRNEINKKKQKSTPSKHKTKTTEVR